MVNRLFVAAMEQMCYDGYNTVTPLYYEQALKLKQSIQKFEERIYG